MKRARAVFYDKSFRFFSDFVLTKRQIRNLYQRFQVIAPGNKRVIIQRCMNCACLLWLLEGTALAVLFRLYPSVFGAACGILAVYVLSGEVISRMSSAAQIRLLEEFDSFLSDVRHYYYNYRMVEEAVYDAAICAGDIIKPQAERILKVLGAEDVKEELSRYHDEVSNRFLRMFLALCVTVLEYGDKEVDGQLLYLNNIKYLKQEIAVELLKRKELKYRFSGLAWITVLPVFFLPAVEEWAVGNLPSLGSFYRGASGILISAVIYVSTWIVYIMLNHLKEREPVSIRSRGIWKRLLKIRYIGMAVERFRKRNYGRCKLLTELLRQVGDTRSIQEFLLSRFTAAGMAFLLCIVLFAEIHKEEKRQAYRIEEGMELTLSAINKTQRQRLEEALPGLLERFIGTGAEREEVEAEISGQGILTNPLLAGEYADEIMERIRQYENARFQWYEFLCAAGVGLVVYAGVYGLLLYRRRIIRMDMEDEVVSFQSILLMLMHMDRINVLAIFEMMENFAVIFKIPIQKCINNYNFGDTKALQELKEECGFEPMKRLADQFLLCDRIGIVQAFDEISVERANFREQRKLDNEMNLAGKTAIGKLISYIPMVLTIGGYLIIPFVRESLTQLLQYAEEMNAM